MLYILKNGIFFGLFFYTYTFIQDIHSKKETIKHINNNHKSNNNKKYKTVQ